jgi:tRNA(Ile)-lysidine synthase
VLSARIRQFFAGRGIPPCPIIAAVSGGTDSTALLLALADLRDDGFSVVCAHVNHHLRGAESDGDEAFVRDLCARLGIPLRVMHGSLDSSRVRDRGVEAAAREIRYRLLQDLRAEENARFVATAHQKNDQAETVLMRLLTGSGIAGLRGIHPVRNDGFVRPLLDVTRGEIESFLRERNVVPCADRSNDDPRFLRNRVRAILRELGSIDALASVAEQAQAQWPLLERAIDAAERESAEVAPHETRFLRWPEDSWLRQALLHRHIHRLDSHARDVSARDLQRLATDVGAIHRASVTKTLELVRIDDALVLRHVPEPVEAFEIELTEQEPAFIPALGITVHIARIREQPATLRLRSGQASNRQRIQLPPDMRPNFTIRNRRNGDRFQPLGLDAPKKLKEFLIDRKIAADVRDRLPLLVCNGEIAWVAGVEVSEKFKVTSPSGVLYAVWTEGSGASDDRDHTDIQR